MEQQQALITVEPQLAVVEGHGWRLDERTREVGRRGVQEARRALRDARRKEAA